MTCREKYNGSLCRTMKGAAGGIVQVLMISDWPISMIPTKPFYTDCGVTVSSLG